MIIPIFVPHNGCPHACIFCNQHTISGTQSSFNATKVRKQIDTYLSSGQNIPHIEIAFYGGSFTGIPIEEQRAYLTLATEYVTKYHLEGIRLSTRPDMISTAVLDFLTAFPVKTIELGVQSMSELVLTASKRGHTVAHVHYASKLIRSYGFRLGLQMMLGLPQDTPDLSLYTADQLIAIDPDMVRIYPTLVIKNTQLASLYQAHLYQPFSLEVTLQLCVTLTERFEAAGITVLRIGLQTTIAIQINRDVLAGPYHPALGQLVTERRWLNYILHTLKSIHEPILLEANKPLYQTLIGHKKQHLPIWAAHTPPVTLKLNTSFPLHSIGINGQFHHEYAQVHG